MDLAPRTFHLDRSDLVAYARASGDHNPIHQDEAVARSVGLPGVIAHGMYTLALAARYVEEALGETGRIAEVGAKFVKPVVVPAEGADVEFTAVDKGDRLEVTATCDGVKVLAACRVRLT